MMKHLVKTILFATVISTALNGQVIADDSDIHILTQPESTLVEFGGGWYLRGDITANFQGSREISNFSDGATESETEFSDMIGYGIGAGYRFSNIFRADITLGSSINGENKSFRQYTEAERGTLSPSIVNGFYVAPDASGPCAGWLIDSNGNRIDTLIENCSEYNTAEYFTSALMANGYLDLTPVGRFEPFIGAGVGVARVRWNEISSGTICTPASAAVAREGCYGAGGTDQPEPNTTYIHGGTINGGVDYRLAFSATAGFAYRVNSNLLLEASYRYMGVSDTMGIYSGSTKAENTAKNGFGLHQVNFGLRYEIW
ncbi:MAG: hypothetical protein L3J32_09280 [Rhizobiaceae bacterium]|nr:hypothetical protein [Rhizobiaceae bacterium]